MGLVLAGLLPLTGRQTQRLSCPLGLMTSDLKLTMQVQPVVLRNLQHKPAVYFAAKRGLEAPGDAL
ncbi:hypothetical protein NKH64_14840 [Mesorhizobium sp. M0999]|uniref:hypothetical protein n=1 Tax=Mesorhizobium sp. M0999 TaxID=2957045 RepID=UPI003336DF39